MKLLMLRGFVPKDRDPKEIVHDGWESEEDMWTFLADALGDERAEIVYVGGKRYVEYSEKCSIRWVKDINHIKPSFNPDCVFCRGGFPEWDKVIKAFPGAYKIYHGAGKRYLPGNKGYSLLLVDSPSQDKRARKHGFNAYLWSKPAAPIFAPKNVAKEFDFCYVADGRFPFRAKIKGVEWVYKTAPKHLKILHLGWGGACRPPKNITVRRVVRGEMPNEYAKCRVGIIPYTDYDSAPRTIPEMIACGLPVVQLDCVHSNNPWGIVKSVPANEFWKTAESLIGQTFPPITGEDMLNIAVRDLKKAIWGERYGQG